MMNELWRGMLDELRILLALVMVYVSTSDETHLTEVDVV